MEVETNKFRLATIGGLMSIVIGQKPTRITYYKLLNSLFLHHLAKAATFEQKHFCPTDARNGLKLIGGESFIQIIDRVNEPILLLPKK